MKARRDHFTLPIQEPFLNNDAIIDLSNRKKIVSQ